MVQEEFAKQELDEWITFRLGIKLRGDYAGYIDKSHTALSRPIYEETFREMLRVKRGVQAAFSTVNYNAAEMGAGAPATENLIVSGTLNNPTEIVEIIELGIFNNTTTRYIIKMS